MTTAFVDDKNLEKHIQKQMGCMAGFLQIFDRHHIITGKRLHATRRLPPVGEATSDSGKSAPPSPDLGKQKQTPPPELPPYSPLPLPIFELKDGVRSSWKFRKEAPRLSLDSRATTDAKGSLHPKPIRTAEEHRSPSVIARLMGLDQLPNSSGLNLPELRRSASESRVSKDLFQSRLTAADCTSLYPKSPTTQSLLTHHNSPAFNPHYTDPRKQSVKKGVNADVSTGVNSGSPWRAPQPRKSFFDVFPEPKQNISIYGEIEKRLRMRGVDEPSKDLETLKHILEALQLKGLLHSNPPPPPQNQVRHRNFIYDDSSIVLMKPTRPSSSKPSNGRKQANGVRRNYSLSGETSPSPSPRRERNARSPTRSGRSGSPISRRVEGSVNASRSNSPGKPKQSLTQRSVNESTPVRSPKINGIGPDRSPRFKKPTVVINQKEKIMTVEDAVSEGTVETPTDTEGKSLLDRCDKLLHNIAEFAAADMQPSPVSVLDPSFDSLTPSPVTTKRNIHFKDHYGESEEEIWSPIVSPIRSKSDCDFVYVSDILRASRYLPEESDVFLLLEKQQHIKGNDTSKVSRLQRKLIFDTITEILAREAWLPPWKAHRSAVTLDKVWSEFQKIRECNTGHEDLFETICGVLKKDLAGDGWGDWPMDVVLDIERLVFKDLVSETIEDLSSSSSTMMLRRKLVF
ncbi:protein LONGIFOLIA 1-like [Salvia divinorum]|uniref:Protein LONGIFOLIA 1-like n=1 Tax=Salvia divinorum TaxID=28513 RepID=A0ABD1H1T7_SALDI